MNELEKRILKAETRHKQEIVLSYCKDKSVLDVGCVGQDLDPASENWLHAKVRKVAKEVVGCDINVEGIRQLEQLGYTIYTPEQLEQNQQRFDIVLMGDVIEHVNDPGAFLEFYKQFLNPGGKILVCTPNAFGIRYILQVFFYGKPSTNPEHTLFLDPFVMLEMTSRISLKMADFAWLYEYQKPGNLQRRIIYGLSAFLIFLRRYYRPNFFITFERTDV